jgi:hypothetical protein
MGQVARVDVPGYPHRITQRENRGQQTFFCEEDYRAYGDLMEKCSGFLAQETATEHVERLRLHERTGRPLGSDEFIGHLEKTIGRRLRLVFLDLAPGNLEWGVHPTRLGWRAIKALWPAFEKLEERAQQG